jgi:maleamate amidohydrolase
MTQEIDIYRNQGFGNSSGFGERPALLMVDFVIAFTDPAEFGGGNILEAVAKTRELLACARRCGIPVAHTRIVHAEDGADAGVFSLKARGLERLTESYPGSHIVPELTPVAGEYVVKKTKPSAFFGTELATWFISKQVDTVIVTGCTTSGCVRASVVDSLSYNFRTIVARDGVGDRALGPHEANLFDMAQKYADLMDCASIARRLEAMCLAS